MSIINKNTINSVSANFRDFLLQKNLKPIYPTKLGQLPSPKIGEPVLETMVGDGSNHIPLGLPLNEYGLKNMQLSVLKNQYQNDEEPYLQQITDVTKLDGPFGDVGFNYVSSPYPTSANDTVTSQGILGKTNSVEYRTRLTNRNLYSDVDRQTDAGESVTALPRNITQNIKGYLDSYGALNDGNNPRTMDILNTIGSFVNGQGIGFTKDGVVNNFDIRSSLAGRVLGGIGVINDTKLGMIGGQQLAFSLGNNAAFNVQQKILGSLNISDNILSLIKGDGLAGFRPDYTITVPSGDVTGLLATASNILGFTVPRSYLSEAGSIFQSENGDVDSLQRNNSTILNTGKGQVTALFKNLDANLNGTTEHDSPNLTTFRSGYAPSYLDNNGKQVLNGTKTYAYSGWNVIGSDNRVIPDMTIFREAETENSGFMSPDKAGVEQSYDKSRIKTPGFTWTSPYGDTVNKVPDKPQYPKSIVVDGETVEMGKSLLHKTQEIFNNFGMKNIVSVKGDMNKIANQIQTAVVGRGISKGNAIMQATNYTKDGVWDGGTREAGETYCRSWTTLDRYDKVKKMVRHTDLDKNAPYRFNTEGSVLDDNGFAKIAPYKTDSKTDPKKFMFSIENLAWNEKVPYLLPVEQGPGDLISGKKGRIMWFPPYNMSFSESSSVNWESTNFLGRGESVYTYNNTERSGQLSFSIVVDHPSYINSFSTGVGSVVDDHYVNSFFGGCVPLDPAFANKLTVLEKDGFETETLLVPQEAVVTPELPPKPFSVYYPNDNATIPDNYENGKCNGVPIDYSQDPYGYLCGIGPYQKNFTPGKTKVWVDNFNFGLNGQRNIIDVDGVPYSGWTDPGLIPALGKYIDEKCPHCVVTVSGYASVQGEVPSNNNLSVARANYIIEILKKGLFQKLTKADRDKRFKVGTTSVHSQATGCIKQSKEFPDPPTDSEECKKDRQATVEFRADEQLIAADKVIPPPLKNNVYRKVKRTITNRFYNELNYFEKLEQEDEFVFDKFREKIRYFHPAFHSTTPEGLNSRLTFLLQCTRQGETLEEEGGDNLAFGRPPVCILRIGDFYNTKIIIDNLTITYEPLVWDLNPEGVGVQPMIANVDISFKFVGGSALLGPLNKLQNALSFNYFANAQVYDPRADYIAKDPDKNIQTDANGKALPQYYVVKGFDRDMNSTVGNPFNTDNVVKGPNIPQDEEPDMTINVEETPEVVPEPPTPSNIIIKSISCDNSSINKTSTTWELLVKIKYEGGSGNPDEDAQTIVNNSEGKKYAINCINSESSGEMYGTFLNPITMSMALTPNSTTPSFIIPIRVVRTSNEPGIYLNEDKDKNKFTLELTEQTATTSKSYGKINIKLK